MPFTESNYENAVLKLFTDVLDYSYAYGPDIDRDYHDPLYEDLLFPALQRINPGLSMEALNEAIYKLKNFETGTLLQKNMTFTDYMQTGVPVKYFVNGEERSALVYLIDFGNHANNDFTVVNQWTIVENSEKRPDVILFVNGLPLVVVELKSGDRCLGRLSAAAQLHVRDPVPVYLQSGLRHERLDHLQGGHHHLRRGSFHGVEGQGWQL